MRIASDTQGIFAYLMMAIFSYISEEKKCGIGEEN
jgi:hypothetical protein